MRKFNVENNTFTEVSSDSFRKYLNEVSALENVLEDKEQKELVRKYLNDGDMAAKERVLKANLRFVISVAKQFNVSSVEFDDLINEGNIGLQQAIERFDPDRGFKFSTYAVWWIKRNIMMYLNDHSRPIKLPLNRITQMFKVKEVKEALMQDLNRDPTVDEIKKYAVKNYEMTYDNVDKALQFSEVKAESLERPVSYGEEEGGATLKDYIPNDNADDPEEHMDEEDEGKALKTIFSNLEEMEAKVIDLYYGINAGVPLPLREVGEEIGRSSELVRQIKNRAENKLKEGISDPRNLSSQQ